MARRTGKEGIHTRVVNKDIRAMKEQLESAEALREKLNFSDVSTEDRRENLEDNLEFFVG